MIFYLDKMQPKGSIVVECGNALLKNGYKVRILNTINFKKSMHYNPFAYVLFAVDIGHRIVFHTLGKVDGVENL